ncbi:flagellar brake protein [Agarivorans sp. 1_MG-2023]|uniref:flagellar brake protein n=1 Tax=Agarivorans sp. 1_MG-2023 TaxID=3062634 RepID=UPI0026E250F0|nr:PilZ domain-containing protein [Agarivorans sp. 1_MG-2023]MDO6761997.1 PilZ domain-containing protein [Agarivorans sp. 1_MG-2023]
MDPIAPELLNEFNALPCQTEVHLQIPTPTNPLRLRSRLIGIEPGMCVILSRGMDQQWEAARDLIREGQSIVVRIVNEGDPNATIFAYRGSISKLMSSVGRWVVLDYPRNIQKISLRQHSRLPVSLPCRMQSESDSNESFKGLLKDLSLNGGGFISAPIPLPLTKRSFNLHLPIDEYETLSIKASICNQHLEQRSPERVHYGLSFDADESVKQKFIQTALLEIVQRENKTPN